MVRIAAILILLLGIVLLPACGNAPETAQPDEQTNLTAGDTTDQQPTQSSGDSQPTGEAQKSYLMPTKAVAADILATYAGNYKMKDETPVVVRVDGSQIFMTEGDQPEFELFPYGDSSFYAPDGTTRIVFYKKIGGGIEQVVISRGTKNLVARPVQ